MFTKKNISIHLCFKDKCVMESGTLSKRGNMFLVRWKKLMIEREIIVVPDLKSKSVVLPYREQTEKTFYTSGHGADKIPVRIWNKSIAT